MIKNNKLIIVAAIIIPLLIVLLVPDRRSNQITKKPYINIDGKNISLILATSTEDLKKGLGGMDSLPEETGMLFVFDKPDKYGIWMKDMKFPLDIIWLDGQGKIVNVKSNVATSTYPNIFFPTVNNQFVLEFNAGFAEKNNLVVGKVLNAPEK